MLMLLLPITILVFLVISFVRTAYHGTRAALRIAPLTPAHRRNANWTLALTGALVVSLEFVLWLGVLPRVEHGIFWWHLPLAITYLVLIVVMRFFITGTYSRSVHSTMGALCTAVFVGMVTTGAILLGQAFFA